MIDIDLRQTLILAILVLYAGKWLTAKLAPLRELNIPEPITGGLLAALFFTLAHLVFDVTFDFALEIRDAFLLVFFTFLVILQAIAFFYRSYLELREGPASEGRFLDKDALGDPTAELVAKIH